MSLLEMKLFQLPATFLAELRDVQLSEWARPAAAAAAPSCSAQDPFAPGTEMLTSVGCFFSDPVPRK